MIILTINSGPHHETRVFPKKSVLIGAVGSPHIDIALEGPGIEPSHLKISEEEGRFIIENIANDPFVTLNELPFGKKTLKNNDLIHVGNAIIAFEGKTEPTVAPPSALMYDTSSELVGIVEHRMQARQQPKNTPIAPASKEKQPFNWEEEENLDVESLIKEVEELDTEGFLQSNEHLAEEEVNVSKNFKHEPPQQAPPPAAVVPIPPPPAAKPAQKRPIEVYDSVNDEQDLAPTEPVELPSQKRSPFRSPAIWISLLALFFLLMAIVSSGVYSRLEKKAGQQELKAASGIADVALALTYAQINGIKAPQQNWTDPDFLNQTIASVLSKQHKSIAEVDHHGHIVNTEYILRIYANRDMTRFLIIAQPEASLTQWLVPKSSIIVDSSKMELRKSNDIKGLNRLLVNPGALNDEGGNSVIALVNSGEIIPLASLADKMNQNGFAPPKALEHVRPGAENLVYNAPRYSQVGEQLLQDAVSIVNNHGNSAELRKLQDQLKVIVRLPNVVLYTSKGLKTALISKKALETLTPQTKYLIAYSRYDSTKGTTSHLIIDDNPPKEKGDEVSLNDPQKGTSPLHSYVLPKSSSEPVYDHARASNAFDGEVDIKSALYLQITALHKERKETLQPIGNGIIEILQKQNEDFVPNFSGRIHLLLTEYETEVTRQQNLIAEKLKKLYQEHHEMSLTDFSSYVKAAGLKGVADAQVQQVEVKAAEPRISNEQLQSYLMKIERSLGFDSLLESTKEIAQTLNLQNIPDANHLARYQNRTRAQTLERLNEFLLSPYSPLSARDFTPANRALLLDIMKSSWISDPEEQKFYLSEFDHHAGAY